MKISKLFLGLSAAVVLGSCAQNAITGRNQLALISDSELSSMAKQEYQQFLSQNKVVSTGASKDAEMVKRVGQRLTAAITKYYAEKGLSKSSYIMCN